MTTFLTARDVANMAGRSKSQVCRDASDGRIKIAHRIPGRGGALLFTEDAANEYAKGRR